MLASVEGSAIYHLRKICPLFNKDFDEARDELKEHFAKVRTFLDFRDFQDSSARLDTDATGRLCAKCGCSEFAPVHTDEVSYFINCSGPLGKHDFVVPVEVPA